MTMSMRIPFILTLQALFLGSTAVLSLEDRAENNHSNDRIARKRIDENGAITNEAKDDIELGRQYLESIWDSLDKNSDRKLEEGRMRYLESMMSMLDMSMSPPASEPTQSTKEPSSPTIPVSPTPAPIRGPTLPTREPIPTRQPTPAPSTAKPVPPVAPVTPEPTESPTEPDLPLNAFTTPIIGAGPCVEAEKDAYLIKILTKLTELSDSLSEGVFLDESTPQGKAYSFLLEEKPSFICKPTIVQRYALSTFYFSLGGDGWTNNKGWLGNKHECNWYGVGCAEDKFDRVATSLNLSVNNLIGTLPNELSIAFGLQEIDLFFNSVNGTLPLFEGLVNLETLNLQQNLLTGPAFPSSVTLLPRLSTYRVSDNKLSGRFEVHIGELRTLEELWAGNNEITGTIPSDIGNLRNLKKIYLNNNKLTGEIPSELGLMILDTLVISDNMFVGPIPNQLFNLASLDSLRLDGNFLSGTLPNFVGQLTDLTTFRVERNSLKGQIPESIGMMTSLVNLGLNKNYWTGTIPDVFENYKQLDFIDVSTTI
eukprot:CAMPEP_0116143342 /NCGR_PEP_ID=MMETSP0329-20121206/15399_1 /TAXON_ID=697910 /ORGANISM="Pseudo-nitzschia arenysensis, Strain B593" /LENGTH=537 /DNA_ID=CAMNT_0003638655 /DNA_START=76 /DNA_END=1690 /DNA_ORIENTATION=-